jgi:hypothetical protein
MHILENHIINKIYKNISSVRMGKEKAENYGKVVGYLFSFFLLTTILFLILRYTQKLPLTWTYLHVIMIIIVIVLIGSGIERMLK